jgi:hypothetical protein
MNFFRALDREKYLAVNLSVGYVAYGPKAVGLAAAKNCLLEQGTATRR